MQNSWEFWYFKRGEKSEEAYKDQLKPLGKISSLEEFFQFYVFLKSPTQLPQDTDLHFFKGGELPMWEESPDGGIWITKLKKNDNVDLMWENLLLAIIGEQFGDLSVVGISLSQRTKDKLI